MFIFDVDGDGLLDTYYSSRQPIMVSVITILVWLIVLLPQHCKPFTHSVYTITKIDDYRVLPLVVVLAMPDHRPHAPYVDVPKWERRMVIISYLAFVYLEIR